MYLIPIVVTLCAGLAPGFEKFAADRLTREDTHEGPRPLERLAAEDNELSKTILELVRAKFAERFDEPELTPKDITEDDRRRPEDNRRRPEDNRRRGFWGDLAAFFNGPGPAGDDPTKATLYLTGARGGESITICDWSCHAAYPGRVLMENVVLTTVEQRIVLPRHLALDIVFNNGGQGNGQAVQLRMFEDFDLIASGEPASRWCHNADGIRGADPFIPVTTEAKCAYWLSNRARQRIPNWEDWVFTATYNWCIAYPPTGEPNDWSTTILRSLDSDFLVNTFSCGDMVGGGSNRVGLYTSG